MNETVTVRVQKVRKNRIRIRLTLFLILAAALLLVAIFADKIVPYDPYAQDLSKSLLPPSAEHWMGTDRYGRDMFSRVVVGAQTSIFSTLALVGVISVFGTAVGTLCGYYGGAMDSVVMRISDVCLAFPGLVFALAIAAMLGGGVGNAVLALAVISWPKYARVARSQTLALKTSGFVAAARLSGDSSMQMILRHILPNILGPILVTAMLDIGTMMMELAGLSFLNLGAQPPTAEWGNMMSGGLPILSVMGTMHEVGYWEGAIDEHTPCNPQSQYGIAKNAMRQSLMLTAKDSPCSLRWLRAYYITGDDLRGNSIFSKIARAAAEGKKQFPFTSGKNKYDFIDVDELAKMIAAASVQNEIDGIINVCTGEPMTLAQRVERYIKEHHYDIELQYGAYPDRAYDSPGEWGDAAKIRTIMQNANLK